MATTRIMPLHVGKGRTESRAISDIIDYVANPKKTDSGRLITGLSLIHISCGNIRKALSPMCCMAVIPCWRTRWERAKHLKW